MDFDPQSDLPSDGGDRDAKFMELLTPRQTSLFGYIFALVPNTEDAHDLYQQTVMVLWRRFDEFEPGTNFTAWAMRTAQLEVLHYRRSLSRSRLKFSDELVQQLAETQLELDRQSQADTRFEFLQECLERLKPADRTLVDECYRGSLQIQEVAAQLGRSSQSICNSLRRIRIALLACVDRKQAQGGDR